MKAKAKTLKARLWRLTNAVQDLYLDAIHHYPELEKCHVNPEWFLMLAQERLERLSRVLEEVE